MRRTALGLLAIGVSWTLVPRTALAADAATICESSKLGASAKYAQCRLKADSKSIKKGEPVSYSKCNLEKFVSAESKAGMGTCPTEADQTTVKDYLDACTSRTATWLAGGGGLPDTCESDLTACEEDLSECVGQLGLPRTGQTVSFGAGSDGDLQRGVARQFTDNGDGTITDHVTGLMWEKKSDDDSVHDKDNAYTWSTGTNDMDGTVATTFLDSLNGGGGFGGYTDWRLPNRNELLSITDMGTWLPATFSAFHDDCSGGCSVTACSCTQSGYYWSTTTNTSAVHQIWSVFFETGDTFSYNKNGFNFVRAVRGGS